MNTFTLDSMAQRWQAAPPGKRLGVVVGLLAIVASGGALLWWLFAANWQVLFSELDPQDAASIVAELDRMKVAHRLQDEGKTVLVEQSEVHKTRLKLMSKGGINLRGTVGFELFADNDFGMTEFAQKINYQRALQGELARTIMSLEEVRAARVHLVLPESGLLRKNEARGKASITITTQPGRRLQSAQVAGIQRLVAAAVPQIDASAVTLLDSRGVALNPALDSSQAQVLAGSEARLELKRETEAYIAQKATAVLDQAIGRGRATVSVDVVLNQDSMRMTQEQVLVAPLEKSDGSVSGAIVRSRQASQKESRPRSAPGGVAPDAAPSQGNESSNLEIEYQHGKRIEQLVSAPGAIRRMSVAVVLPETLSAAQQERLTEVVAMAVGLVVARGDGIALVSKDQLSQGVPAKGKSVPEAQGATPADEALGQDDRVPTTPASAALASQPSAKDQTRGGHALSDEVLVPATLGLLLIAVLVAGLLIWRAGRSRAPTPMTGPARQAMLRELNEWLAPRSGQGSQGPRS